MTTVAESTHTIQFDAALREAVSRATAAYPEEQTRILKAQDIVYARTITLQDDGVALVESQQQPGVVYEVNGHCTCPDAARAPEGRCKHRWARSLYRWTKHHTLAAGPDEAGVPELTAEEPTSTGLDRRYITYLHGKPFVRYAGLLSLAHERGLLTLEARIEQHSETLVLASATATFSDGRRYTDWADATPANVGAQVKAHWIRMALTRAKGRCLRDALGVELCTVEELSED